MAATFRRRNRPNHPPEPPSQTWWRPRKLRPGLARVGLSSTRSPRTTPARTSCPGKATKCNTEAKKPPSSCKATTKIRQGGLAQQIFPLSIIIVRNKILPYLICFSPVSHVWWPMPTNDALSSPSQFINFFLRFYQTKQLHNTLKKPTCVVQLIRQHQNSAD